MCLYVPVYESRWNSTAADTCRERNMNLRSFAMLLPCGISLFSGVEFVCCPKHLKGTDTSVLHNATVKMIVIVGNKNICQITISQRKCLFYT